MPQSWDDRHHWESQKRQRGRSRRRGRRRRELSREEQALREARQRADRKLAFIRHFVWNNMDPDGNRAEENPDCIPLHHEFQLSLELAMEYLHSTGRSFRAERVPLCFMKRFAWSSTEARKIIKEEERARERV